MTFFGRRVAGRFAITSFLLLYHNFHGQSADKVTMSEPNFRQAAAMKVMPDYPLDAVRRHQTGVVVVKVKVDESGNISEATILEAPAPSIAASTVQAVKQWRFGVFTVDGQPTSVSSKLTFYFVMKGGKGVVQDPADAGYVGRWPEKQKQESRHRKAA